MDVKQYGNVYTSIYKHLETLFTASGLMAGNAADVTLLDAYPADEDLDKIMTPEDYAGLEGQVCLPVITLEVDELNRHEWELGSSQRQRVTRLTSTIFALNRVQSDFLIGMMEDFLDRDIDIKDYGDTSQPSIGTLYVRKPIRVLPLKFAPTANTALRWGADIYFEVENIST